MTPTTILIETAADAKVLEVIEQRYTDVRWWDGGDKPTEWKPNEGYPHLLLVDSDNELTWLPYTTDYDITATEWLAQHGYVPDGEGYKLNIETPIHPAVVHMNADPNFLKNPDDVKINIKLVQEAYDTPVEPPYRELQVGDTVEALMDYLVHDILILKAGKKYPVLSSEPDYFTIKCEIQKMQWKHSRIHEMFKYVAPVSAPTRTEQEPLIVTMEKQKQATIDKIKLSDRTEQREKELTEQGYVKFTGNVEAYWLHPDINYIVHQFDIENQSDADWGSNFAYATGLSKQPQPAPYTAGQEVERIFNAETCHTKRVIFDHEHNGIAYVKYPESTYPVGVSLDSIRPVQAQPEMPEWEAITGTYPLGDTGDYETTMYITNGQLNLYLENPDNEDLDELKRLCSVLNRPLITPKQVTDEEIGPMNSITVEELIDGLIEELEGSRPTLPPNDYRKGIEMGVDISLAYLRTHCGKTIARKITDAKHLTKWPLRYETVMDDCRIVDADGELVMELYQLAGIGEHIATLLNTHIGIGAFTKSGRR